MMAVGCSAGDDGGSGGPGGDADDGGSVDGADDDDGAEDGGDGLPSNVNGELRGVLYFDAPYDYVELDLSSSLQRVVRGRAGDVEQEMTPSADAQEFVTTDDPLSGSLQATDLLLTDRDGTTVAGFELAENLGRPKLSADGSRIALTLDSVPTVLDRDAQIVAQFADLEGARDLDWTPDGRLLVARGDSIHVVDAGLSAPRLLARFPDDRPDFLAVSPDGNQLAFDLGDPDVGEDHVFVMDMDGSNLRQLTTSGLNEDAPTWSPDGRWIIVRSGVVYLFGEEITCPELWAVPSDATSAEVASGAPGPAFLVQQLEDGALRNICAFSEPEWRATPEPLASLPGTAPVGDGLNAGLVGHLYYDGFHGSGGVGETSGFVEIDVADGEGRLLPLPPGVASFDASAPFVTRDGEELSFVQDDPDSGELGVEQITIQRLDGTRTASFEQLDSFSGQPKISPDGQRVAVEWHSIDLDDDGGVPVVTVFDRAGAVQVRWVDSDQWEWLPDGRLLLADRNTLWMTDATMDDATEIAALSDDISGMQLSPDGTRLAFGMNGHVWTMGVDGTGLRRMTSAREAVHSPAWSPDGRYLAVRLEETCPEVYVIPADGERVSVGDPTVSSSAWQLRQIDGDERNVCAFSLMTWR